MEKATLSTRETHATRPVARWTHESSPRHGDLLKGVRGTGKNKGKKWSERGEERNGARRAPWPAGAGQQLLNRKETGLTRLPGAVSFHPSCSRAVDLLTDSHRYVPLRLTNPVAILSSEIINLVKSLVDVFLWLREGGDGMGEGS